MTCTCVDVFLSVLLETAWGLSYECGVKVNGDDLMGKKARTCQPRKLRLIASTFLVLFLPARAFFFVVSTRMRDTKGFSIFSPSFGSSHPACIPWKSLSHCSAIPHNVILGMIIDKSFKAKNNFRDLLGKVQVGLARFASFSRIQFYFVAQNSWARQEFSMADGEFALCISPWHYFSSSLQQSHRAEAVRVRKAVSRENLRHCLVGVCGANHVMFFSQILAKYKTITSNPYNFVVPQYLY